MTKEGAVRLLTQVTDVVQQGRADQRVPARRLSPPHGGLGAERHHVLVLPEPAGPVYPVPVPDAVERVKERADGLDLVRPVPWRLAVPGLVGQRDRRPVDQARRARSRGPQPCRRPEGERILPVGGRQVFHLVFGEAELDKEGPDLSHSADRDSHFLVAPHMPFLEEHVGYLAARQSSQATV